MRFGLLVLLAGMGLTMSFHAWAQPVGIGTSPQGTLTYTLGATYAKALEEATGIKARVQPSSGTGVMVPLVNSGELDIGFVNTLELTEAYTGTGVFNGRPQKDLRAVGVLFPIRVGIFVRKDSPIRSLKELKGKRIPYGYTSQEIIKTVLDGVLANAGLTAGDTTTILVPNLIRGVDEFTSGNADATFFALGQAKVAEADAAVGGIRFLPMVDEPDAVAAMQKIVPTSYLATVQPAPNLPGVTEPIKTMHYDYVMFVNASLPKDRVYKMTAALVEKKDDMAKSMALFRQFDVARMNRQFAVPYHEGAAAYFKEKGIAATQ
ncbi:MAG TPA: TAXI family TRAP transporter solute-binding subunit [Alphaproteobacteria bacterium]